MASGASHGVTTCHRHPVALESIHVPSSPHIRIGLMPPVSYTEQLSNEIDFDFAKFCYESLNIIRRKDITHPNYMDVLKKLNLLSLDGNLKKMYSTHMFMLSASYLGRVHRDLYQHP